MAATLPGIAAGAAARSVLPSCPVLELEDAVAVNVQEAGYQGQIAGHRWTGSPTAAAASAIVRRPPAGQRVDEAAMLASPGARRTDGRWAAIREERDCLGAEGRGGRSGPARLRQRRSRLRRRRRAHPGRDRAAAWGSVRLRRVALARSGYGRLRCCARSRRSTRPVRAEAVLVPAVREQGRGGQQGDHGDHHLGRRRPAVVARLPGRVVDRLVDRGNDDPPG